MKKDLLPYYKQLLTARFSLHCAQNDNHLIPLRESTDFILVQNNTRTLVKVTGRRNFQPSILLADLDRKDIRKVKEKANEHQCASIAWLVCVPMENGELRGFFGSEKQFRSLMRISEGKTVQFIPTKSKDVFEEKGVLMFRLT